MKITYGKDKNGGSRDILIDGVVVVPEVLSSDAVEVVEKIGQAVDDAIAETKRQERLFNEEVAQKRKVGSTSTVGRGKAVVLDSAPSAAHFTDDYVSLHYGNSLDLYKRWPVPTTIVSDGAYGVLGFEGDTSDHLDVPDWYEPHVKAWAEAATPNTTLWFWNSEIGWAAAHPILEKYGWRYVNCNIWNKGIGHIAGNVNTQKIRRFPVVTEVCVQYVFEARIGGKPLKRWLLDEWKRTGMPQRKANEACGVKDAATRKYLDQGHLWYFPPPEAMQQLSDFANTFGDPAGKPYFSMDGVKPVSQREWAKMRTKFNCPHGVTNVWERNAVRGDERVKVDGGRAVHLNQKPLDLMKRIIEASTDEGDVVWEPFGGLFSGSLAARQLHRKAYAGEIDPTYYQYGVQRHLDSARIGSVPLVDFKSDRENVDTVEAEIDRLKAAYAQQHGPDHAGKPRHLRTR